VEVFFVFFFFSAAGGDEPQRRQNMADPDRVAYLFARRVW